MFRHSFFCVKVKEHDKKPQTPIQLAIWRLLSLSRLGSRKHVRWPASLCASKLLELCVSICSKVISWLEVSKKCIKKVSSMATDKLLSDNFGNYDMP